MRTTALSIGFASLLLTVAAEQHEVTITKSGGIFAETSFPADADVVVTSVAADATNPRQRNNYTIHSLDVRLTDAVRTLWYDGTGKFTLGGGGLRISNGNTWACGNNSDAVRYVLAESQTWTGPSENGSSASIFIGYNGYQNYCHSLVSAAPDAQSWTLAGHLNLFLSGSNDLSQVDVTVNPEARLRIIAGYRASGNDYVTGARLHARSLTVKGDGTGLANLTVGKNHDCGFQTTTPPAPAGFDADILAPIVTLDGDVRVDGGTVLYRMPDLRARNGESVFTGDITLAPADTPYEITIDENASLAFAGTVGEAAGSSASLSVSGFGTLSLPLKAGISGGLAVDGTTLAFSGSGVLTLALTGAGRLAFESDGTVYVPGETFASFACSEIVVTAGTLVLDEVPSGVTVTTRDTGCLKLSQGVDFDPAAMGGTQNCVFDPLLVTGAPLTAKTLTVAEGEILLVYGSGLKASSSLTVSPGGEVRFLHTATIAAPVRAEGSCTVSAIGSETVGTCGGGVVTANGTGADADICFRSEGLVRVCGWSHEPATGVAQYTSYGDVEFAESAAEINGKMNFFSGTTTIRTTVTPLKTVDMDKYQTGDVKVVIAEGGLLLLGNNVHVSLGNAANNDWTTRLVVDGGTLQAITQDRIRFDNGNATLELNAGTIETYRQLSQQEASKSAAFIWRGGTLRAGTLKGKYTSFNYASLVNPASKGIAVSIEGDDCTLDLSEFPGCTITNTAGASAWTGKPGARLKVINAKGVPGRFVMRNFAPDGLGFDLNDAGGSSVELLDLTGEQEITWVAPGTNGVLRAVNADPTAAPSLVASYFVPTGATFEKSALEGWHDGFAAITQKDLTFASGATYLVRTAGGTLPELVLPGTIGLPDALFFKIDVSAGRLAPGTFTLATAGAGITGACTFTPAPHGGTTTAGSTVFVDGNALSCTYKPLGLILTVK